MIETITCKEDFRKLTQKMEWEEEEEEEDFVNKNDQNESEG